jgi:quinol monooxygenase YgiN
MRVSKEDLQRHLASAHVRELLKRVDEFCVSAPEITFWEELL